MIWESLSFEQKEAMACCLGHEFPHGQRFNPNLVDEEIVVQINGADAMQIANWYCRWHLGDAAWARLIIGIYEAAKGGTA